MEKEFNQNLEIMTGEEKKEQLELMETLTRRLEHTNTSVDFSRRESSNTDKIDELEKKRTEIQNMSLEELRAEYAQVRMQESKFDRQCMASDIRAHVEKKGSYSETLKIGQNGKFDTIARMNDGKSPYIINLGGIDNEGIFESTFAETPENLYQLAYKIAQENPDLDFRFENDPKGQWIKYTVVKKIKE